MITLLGNTVNNINKIHWFMTIIIYSSKHYVYFVFLFWIVFLLINNIIKLIILLPPKWKKKGGWGKQQPRRNNRELEIHIKYSINKFSKLQNFTLWVVPVKKNNEPISQSESNIVFLLREAMTTARPAYVRPHPWSW